MPVIWPDVAQVHAVLGRRFSCLDDVAVYPAQADGVRTHAVQLGNDLFVDLAGQHHLHHFHGFIVGHPETVHKLGLHVQGQQHVVDVRAAAVHHDGIHAHKF